MNVHARFPKLSKVTGKDILFFSVQIRKRILKICKSSSTLLGGRDLWRVRNSEARSIAAGPSQQFPPQYIKASLEFKVLGEF